MKSIYFYIGLCICFPFLSAQAQENIVNREKEKNKYLKLEVLGVGASVNFYSVNNKVNSNLLSGQSNIGLSSTILRATHLFSPTLGWYAGINMNLFKEKKSPYYDATFGDVIGEFAMSLFYGGYIPSPIVDGGLVYRIQKSKWDINPRIGYGYGSVLFDRDSDKTKVNSEGSQERTVYKQRIGSSVLNLGIGANYFFGKRSFIALNTTFSQPLQKSYAELSVFKDDVQTEFRAFNSSSIGRNLNLTVGYGFFIGNRNVSE